MAKVRVGLVGTGGMGAWHARELLTIAEAEIVALVDPVAVSIEKVRERHPALRDIPAFDSHRRMLAEVAPDAAVIATPHHVHFEQARDALESGAHVLCEKPFVADPAEARQLVEIAERRGKLLAVAYQRHSQRTYRYIRESVQAGKIGRLQFVQAYMEQDWLGPTAGTWRQDPSQSGGGQLNDSGSHLVDVVTWIVDQPADEVMTYLDNLTSPVDINSSVTVRYQGGVLASLTVIGHAPMFREEVIALGEKGQIVCRDGKIYETLFGGEGTLEVRRLPREVTPDCNFVEAIQGKDELHAPAGLALRTVDITAAFWRSARDGRPARVEAPAATASR